MESKHLCFAEELQTCFHQHIPQEKRCFFAVRPWVDQKVTCLDRPPSNKFLLLHGILTSFEKLPNYEIYRERYLQIYIDTLIYKVYTNALYIIPFCLHLVNCCRGKFTSTANRSNAYVYDTVMCQWCLWLGCHMYKAPLRVCGGRDNEISTTNFYVVPPLLTHLRCKKFGEGI